MEEDTLSSIPVALVVSKHGEILWSITSLWVRLKSLRIAVTNIISKCPEIKLVGDHVLVHVEGWTTNTCLHFKPKS